jgi:Icc-related predicted phosphoesterase
MKLIFISDTHCQLDRIDIPDGDILIHCGDALSRGSYREWEDFLSEYADLPHKYKIYVPGNHDIITEQDEDLIKRECAKAGIIYLNNMGIELEGINFWGSAITPRFYNWAWNKDSGNCGTSYKHDDSGFEDIDPYWKMIPDDTDILITHGPPAEIMDISIYDNVHCGCPLLRYRVEQIEPKIHAFGHIHNWHGTKTIGKTQFINASNCDEKYRPVNKPIVVEYK